MTHLSLVSTLGRWGTAGAALVAFAILAVVLLGGRSNEGVDTVTTSEKILDTAIPAIDAAAPVVTETATFALG